VPPMPERSLPDFDEVRRKADEFARQASSDVFARFERRRSGLEVNLPIVSAIIEREHDGEQAILVQTRWKPDRDSLYAGALDIPAGGMHVYENVNDAVKREVLEETGTFQRIPTQMPFRAVFMRGWCRPACMDDLVVAQEASDVESSSRLDFLLLHNLRRRFIA
jgi:8-oxo-dGTP pyrophosphatase MutT (NUDIX family)